jgi:hypothetical protein
MRGAVNAMHLIDAPQCALTGSFRFGVTFAALASRILRLLGERTPLRGQSSIASTLIEGGETPDVDAILCRKNVTVVGALANGLLCGHRVAVRANVEEILAFAEGADLDSVKQNGRFTDNHLGRSTGLIVGGYSAMFVAPSL